MSKLRWFVESAASVASVQESILNAMETVFPASDYPQLEATILAPGYEDWESRAIKLIKMGVQEHWGQLKAEVDTTKERAVSIWFEEFPKGRPFKPSLTVSRIFAKLWGA